jgi:tetratricopeptide (TPR) repeat protein
MQIFPDSPRIEEARNIKREIHDRLGKKHFINAKLYFSMKRYDAALIYFDKVIASFPETDWAIRSHYYKGLIIKDSGDRTGAVRELEIALQSELRFPERRQAEDTLRSLRGGSTDEEE